MNADVFIGLGGNLGDSQNIFEQAIERIREIAPVTALSSLYRSKPLGYGNQPDFLNAVVRISTDLPPLPLLIKLQAIEIDLGKTIVCENGPRSIDLDLLLHGDDVLKNDQLEIPHPGIPERDFVLLPLKEIDPDLLHPTLNRSVAELSQSISVKYVMDSRKNWLA